MTKVIGQPRTVKIATAPDWFLALADYEWTTVAGGAGQTISDVGPANQGVMSAWTGGAVDQVRKELILAANGGHLDYSGNEVYALDLSVETPAWAKLTDPSVADGNDVKNGPGTYADGNPRSVHGWHKAAYANGKFFYAGLTGMYSNGRWTTACFSFDRATLTWTALGLAFPTLPGGSSNWIFEGGPGVYDSVSDEVFSFVNQTVTNPRHTFFSVNATTGAITQYPNHPTAIPSGQTLGGGFAVCCPDLRVIFVQETTNGRLLKLDLNNVDNAMVEITQSDPFGGTLAGSNARGLGAFYHQADRAIYCYQARGSGLGGATYGRNIRKLSIPADLDSGTYTWSEITGTGAAAPGSVASNFQGYYGKANYIEDMGDGRGALVAIGNITEPAYVMAIP